MSLQRYLETVGFYTNPLRSSSIWPRMIVNNPVWGNFWSGMDRPRQSLFEYRNRKFSFADSGIENENRSLCDRIVSTLKDEGICVLPAFISGNELETLTASCREYFEKKRGVHFDGFSPAKVNENATTRNKDYLIRIEGNEFRDNSSLVFHSIRQEFLQIANAYLNIHALLRSVNIWMNLPTGGPERASQLWHCDGSDFRILKIFTYLTDVTEDNGPFCYMPGTHYNGCNRDLVARMNGRFSSEKMARTIPGEKWKVCTAPAGSVVFADTTGLHCGGRCEKRIRILHQSEYTGHFPWQHQTHDYSRHCHSKLTRTQEIALGKY